MKKFALIFSAFTVVGSAFAVTPEVNVDLPKVSADVETVKVAADMFKGEKVLVKKSNASSKKVMKKADALSLSYEEPSGLFALGLTKDFYVLKYAFHKGPAYKPLTWTNTSVGATDYEWEYAVFVDGEETFEYSSDKDLTKSETYSIVSAPMLYGVSADGDEGAYQIDPENYMFMYGGNCSLDGEQDYGMTTNMNMLGSAGFSYFSSMGYQPGGEDMDPTTGIMDVYTAPEPDGYGYKNVEFKGFANVFHTPAAPYYITKMWGWFNIQAKKTTTVELNFYKIDEDGYMTDEVLASGSCNLTRGIKPESKMLEFELYALDEDGLQTDEPIVIDCPFIAVMTFNKNDIAAVYPVAGTGNTYPVNDEKDFAINARMVFDVDGEEVYHGCPYRYFTDDARTEFMEVTDWAWMVDAVMPWIYSTNGESEVQIPNEGGNAVFALQSYYNLASVPYMLSEDADWIDFESATVATDPVSYDQILTFPCAALPEGVTGRSATVTVDAPAAEFVMTINQGEAGVNVVVADSKTVYYDLAGRRVVNPDKGIYVKVSGNKAEKVVL